MSNLRLIEYEMIWFEGDEDFENTVDFVATSDEEAKEIAKTLYYVGLWDHWVTVARDDQHVYTLDNINMRYDGSNDITLRNCETQEVVE